MARSAAVFCNPILDLIASSDEEWFRKYNLNTDGYTMYDAELHTDIYERLMERNDVLRLPGGSGQNSARILKSCWKGRNIPGEVAFIGCVGGVKSADGEIGLDVYAREMKETAEEKNGLKCYYDISLKHSSGVCAVNIPKDGKTRSLCTDIGATGDLSDEYIKSILPITDKAQLVCVTGYFVTANEAAMKDICRRSTANKQTLVLALSAPFIIEAFPNAIKTCGDLCHVLIGNENEWTTYGKHVSRANLSVVSTSQESNGEETGDSNAAMSATTLFEYMEDFVEYGTKHFHPDIQTTTTTDEHPAYRIAICTRGSSSTLVTFLHSNDTKMKSLRREVPVPPVTKIVDTNGAGDAFLGAFLSGLEQFEQTENADDQAKCLENLIQYSSGVAAVVLGHNGFDFCDSELSDLTF